MRLALIDADVVLYRAAWACEKAIDWDDGLFTLHVSEAAVGQAIDSIVESIEHAVSPDRVLFCLSDKRNFRNDVYPQYKWNRKELRKPIAFMAARRYIESSFPNVCREGLEADDVMGIIATGKILGYESCDDKIVCSIDKDMLQIPGVHYRWNEPDRGMFRVEPLWADVLFYIQALAGDPTDGYPGAPGVGPKTAAKILTGAFTHEECWARVVKAYEDRGCDEAYALQMARCARILRASDYNFKTKEVTLWTPRKPTPVSDAPATEAGTAQPESGSTPTPAKPGPSQSTGTPSS